MMSTSTLAPVSSVGYTTTDELVCALCPETEELHTCLDCGATLCFEHRRDFPLGTPEHYTVEVHCVPCLRTHNAQNTAEFTKVTQDKAAFRLGYRECSLHNSIPAFDIDPRIRLARVEYRASLTDTQRAAYDRGWRMALSCVLFVASEVEG